MTAKSIFRKDDMASASRISMSKLAKEKNGKWWST